MGNATLRPAKKICKRCNKNVTEDIICASCKNELLSKYDSRIGWKTAYEIEKISRYVMRKADIDDAEYFSDEF